MGFAVGVAWLDVDEVSPMFYVREVVPAMETMKRGCGLWYEFRVYESRKLIPCNNVII